MILFAIIQGVCAAANSQHILQSRIYPALPQVCVFLTNRSVTLHEVVPSVRPSHFSSGLVSSHQSVRSQDRTQHVPNYRIPAVA